MKKYFFFILLSALILSGCSHKKIQESDTSAIPETVSRSTQEPREEKVANEKILNFAALDADYTFHGSIPDGWREEYLSDIQAINIYDPQASAESSLDQSKIFVRKFRAGDFLTLATVNILEREEIKIQSHSAVRYVIEKKAAVADFPQQPEWRNTKHTVVDIRKNGASPTFFYVFAKAPSLPEETFQAFLNNLEFWNDQKSYLPPVSDAQSRTTKKPFGLFVTPETSPVSNDRFTGYHTGLDFETTPEEKDRPVPVAALCGGKILERNKIEGYGGVILQSCERGSEAITIVYGHIAYAGSFPQPGTWVLPGQQIAELAPGESEFSGGERKHLHLGVYRGSNTDIRGYVPEEQMLSRWIDPASLLSRSP